MEKIDVYLPSELVSKVKEDADGQLISCSAVVRQIVATHYGYSMKRDQEVPSIENPADEGLLTANEKIDEKSNPDGGSWPMFETKGERTS